MAEQKLWDKGTKIDEKIEKFTIGKDRELDLYLAEFDVLGSMAHVKMLEEVGIISKSDYPIIKKGLIEILQTIQSEDFSIDDHIEDVHSQVEVLLIQKIGELGGKIHTGRSRNDQVLLDLKLFYRKKLSDYIEKIGKLALLFLEKADENKNVLMPGYTHTQVAMTSSFGMWFGAFGEGLYENLQFLNGIFPIINKNPLGSAAGYGSSFPLNRTTTTKLLGFDGLHFNPINAQYNRGKSELLIAQSLANIALNINKFANDMILYSNENYRFLSLPTELTTGSSIMPHKKNPDVYELIRAHTNLILNLPNQVTLMITNLTTGYHRDFQLLKELIFPAFEKMDELIEIITYTLPRISLNNDIVEDEKYEYLLTVDAVNELVMQGIPFRKAYLRVGKSIQEGTFEKPKKMKHTHEGSLGNLCIEEMKSQVDNILKNNPYESIQERLSILLSN